MISNIRQTLGVVAILVTLASSAQSAELYKEANASVEARINDLLGRMTIEEKVAQLRCIWDEKTKLFDARGMFDAAKAGALFPDGFGGLARPGDWAGSVTPADRRAGRSIEDTVALINAIQHWAVEDTRLGIPVLFHEEALHGYVARDATSFPQAIALASTWDPELLERVNTLVAREVRARGVHEVLSPVVDIVRDPRWGRTEETFGEDPYLVSRMSVAAVRGYQGETLPLAKDRVLATLKHMTGHGWPENGINVGPANIGERTLRTDFFPPFLAAIREANAQLVMASYNEIDGVPSHANQWLLEDVLRGEWGFKGAVVSDYYGVEQLDTLHHVVPDLADAAVRALHSGVAMDLPDGEAFGTIKTSLGEGRLAMDVVDRAVREILRIKFLAGLFDNPYADAQTAEAVSDTAEAGELATEAARKAVILLKNDGTLPLDGAKLRNLAVIGPNANVALLGGYSGTPKHTVNVLEGIRSKVGDRVKVVFSEGVRITESVNGHENEVVLADPAQNAERIREAVKAAEGADAVILVLGGNPQTSREGYAANHLGDRADLGLIGQQNDLFDAMKALGKPIVLVLLNGRPLAIPEIAEQANALLEGWYLGENGGTAMADILFGDANPGGKLPITVPRSVGQLPQFHDVKPSARRGYLFTSVVPLFPFGFGLSYTKFEIGAPRLASAAIKAGAAAEVSVDVKNIGSREGDEVVQLYIHDLVSSVTTPVKRLAGFQRVTLKPGESRTVTLSLTPESLALWDGEMKQVVEPGEFEIMVGNSSVNLKSAKLTVSGDVPVPVN